MILLTGYKHSGKTGRVLEISRRARLQGLRTAGVACPGLWHGSIRAGFDLLELDTGMLHVLSRSLRGLKPVPFMFDAFGLERGKQALSAERCGSADLVVVDEVGPLELEGGGWARCLDNLCRLTGPAQIWVVRKSLVRKVSRHFGISPDVADISEISRVPGLW